MLKKKLKKILSKVDTLTIFEIVYYVFGFSMIALGVPLLLFLITIVLMRVFIELEIRKR